MTRASLRAFFAGASFVLLLGLVSGCGSKLIPQWNGKIYSVDPLAMQFVRAQEDERIDIETTRGAWVAMTQEDFESFVATYVGQCQKYPRSAVLVKAADEVERHESKVLGQ